MFGFDASIVLAALAFIIAPFVINVTLARSRGKSIALMLLLTCIFSWIVTLVLACLPKVEAR